MKILNIPEENEQDLGAYGPACEGFIDTIKGMFFKDPRKERALALSKEKHPRAKALEKDLERDLGLTYDNPKWIAKHLANNSGTIKIKALEHANVEGKVITNPAEIVKVARGMLDFLRQVVSREIPFVERRLKLIKEIENEKDPAKVDAFWVKHEKELKVTPVERMRTYVKKPVHALGHQGDDKEAWPFNFKDPRRNYFDSFGSVSTDGSIETPTPTNAKVFATAIRELFEISKAMQDMEEEIYVPYWDDGLAAEYDLLEHGDDLYDNLFSSQTGWEVMDLVGGARYELGAIICGIYIAMFDKHMVAKTAANEGWVDRVKNVFTSKRKDVDYKFDRQRAFDKACAYLESPEKFSLTGKAFTAADKLYLSVNGRAPSIHELPAAFDKTAKAAMDLEKKFHKDRLSHASLCGPIIERFEHDAVNAMDKDGNMDEADLNKIMEPVVAAMPKILRSYYHTFGKEFHQCDGWVGGNPFQMMEKTRKIAGMTQFTGASAPLKYAEAVPAADEKSLRALIQVMRNHSYENQAYFGEGQFDLDEFEHYVNYRIDRPVSHLAGELEEQEQIDAIFALYSGYNNTQWLMQVLGETVDLVYVSILKYIDQSITKA
jgi:hypothetical protein